MRKGDTVTLCGPEGKATLAELIGFDGTEVTVRVLSEGISSEPPGPVTLFQGLTKGDKFELIIQKSVETGVTRIVPFISSRCIAKLEDCAKTEKKLERWRRISEEAAKQCGRGIVPGIAAPVPFEEAVRQASEAAIPFLCYEREESVSLKELLVGPGESAVSFLIGPEGGFSENEAEYALKSGVRLCGLGKRILRTETAPVFVLSCITFMREL